MVVVVMVMVMLFFFRFIVRKGRLITTLFLNCLLGMVRVVFFRCFTLRKRWLLMSLFLGMVVMFFFFLFTLRKRRLLLILLLEMATLFSCLVENHFNLSDIQIPKIELFVRDGNVTDIRSIFLRS